MQSAQPADSAPAEADLLASRRLIDGELTLDLVGFSTHLGLRVPAYHFRMVHSGSRDEIGRINLRVFPAGSPVLLYAGHIGYAVNEAYRGHRYAARAVRLLLPLARALALHPLWITCNPDNAASRRSCELAGAEFAGIVDVPEDTDTYREGMHQKCRYRLDLQFDLPAGTSRLAGHVCDMLKR